MPESTFYATRPDVVASAPEGAQLADIGQLDENPVGEDFAGVNFAVFGITGAAVAVGLVRPSFL